MIIKIHPENPQQRLVKQAVEAINRGGIIAFPTDSAYALGCGLGNKSAQGKIRQLRKLSPKHRFTLICADLSDLSLYAKVDNTAFRLIKKLTPGPYTFILEAGREVPRRLQNPKRRTIGLRVPDNKIAQEIIAQIGEPIMSTTLIMPGDELPLSDPEEIEEKLRSQIDLTVDGGILAMEPTTVVHLENGVPEITRRGGGSVDFL